MNEPDPNLLALLSKVEKALDTLADDAIEAGHPTRGKAATYLAMRVRTAIRDLKGIDP